MNIYFACSLTGGRKDEAIYKAIVDHLESTGHEVPTAHLAHPEVMRVEKVIDPAEVYHRDIDWIDHCDAVVAEVSTPSHGVGYEIAYSLGLGKPVLCCFKHGVPVSKMITGNSSVGLALVDYQDVAEALAEVDKFLSAIS
jgi:nucleoside 2-deoxyribosyltransferase